MTWLLVTITPLASTMKPEPCTSFGWLGAWPPEVLPAFIPAVGEGSTTNEVMLTTLGNRPRINSTWFGGIICICCAAAGDCASSSKPAARARPGHMIDQDRWRIVAGSIGITAPVGLQRRRGACTVLVDKRRLPPHWLVPSRLRDVHASALPNASTLPCLESIETTNATPHPSHKACVANRAPPTDDVAIT